MKRNWAYVRNYCQNIGLRQTVGLYQMISHPDVAVWCGLYAIHAVQGGSESDHEVPVTT